MDRAAFVLDGTGRRVSCLLNPEHVVQRRTAGVVSPRPLGSAGRIDDPVLAVGGGRPVR